MNNQDIEKAIEQLKIDILHHEAIIARNNEYPEYCKGEQLYIDALNLAISALAQQLNNGWIPVSEKLPDENEVVLIYAKSLSRGSYVQTFGLLSNGSWFTESGVGLLSYPNGDNYEVLAWKPKDADYQPETYEEGSK